MLYRYFLLSIGLFIASLSNAQKYFPFPTTDAYWNIHFESGSQHDPPDTSLLRYSLGGDSIVNYVSYIKLLEELGDTANPQSSVAGILVERNKKIYYRGGGILNVPEYDSLLLYDFTKGVGDTIYHSQTKNILSIIQDIDSVLVGGEFRKRYRVDCSMNYVHPPTDYWIEGIGSVLNGPIGFISDIPTSYVYWEFVCYHDQSVEYVNPRFESCFPDYFFMGLDNTENLKSAYAPYPNPCNNILYFENDQPGKSVEYYICIYDIVGNTILKEHTNKPSVVIDELIQGMYLIEITTEFGIYKHKFLKVDA